MSLNTYTHKSVHVEEQESALGEEREFLVCDDCGLRTTLKNVSKFENVPCEEYRRST